MRAISFRHSFSTTHHWLDINLGQRATWMKETSSKFCSLKWISQDDYAFKIFSELLDFNSCHSFQITLVPLYQCLFEITKISMRNIDLGVAKGSALSRKPIMSKSIGFDGISLYLKCFWRNCILCVYYVWYYFEWIHVTIKRAANLFVRRFAFWIKWL